MSTTMIKMFTKMESILCLFFKQIDLCFESKKQANAIPDNFRVKKMLEIRTKSRVQPLQALSGKSTV